MRPEAILNGALGFPWLRPFREMTVAERLRWGLGGSRQKKAANNCCFLRDIEVRFKTLKMGDFELMYEVDFKIDNNQRR